MDIVFILTLFLVVIFSLTLGSFLSAVTYRIERNLDFVNGRSFCDNCKAKISWYNNIPLLSYLILKGKSSCCGKKISLRYPVIELTVFLGFIYFFLSTFPFYYYPLFLVTLSIFIIDLETQIIPDELVWIILSIFLVFSVSSNVFTSLFSALLASLLILLLNLLTNGKGMGLGDVKLVLGLGLFFNLLETYYWLTLSFVIGGIVAVFLLLLKRAKLKSRVAFGPFIIIAFWIALILIKQ